MGGGEAIVRFADLMELAELVGQISGGLARSRKEKCKDNYAACVRGITPHGERNER